MGLNLWFSELPGELDQAKASGQECPPAYGMPGRRDRTRRAMRSLGRRDSPMGAIIARKRPRGRPPGVRPSHAAPLPSRNLDR
jgi:WhiB family transcriptional regulator, redox-sensing transcriptional regulator